MTGASAAPRAQPTTPTTVAVATAACDATQSTAPTTAIASRRGRAGSHVLAPPLDELAEAAGVHPELHERAAREARDRETGVPVVTGEVDVLDDLGPHRGMATRPAVVVGRREQAWPEGDG